MNKAKRTRLKKSMEVIVEARERLKDLCDDHIEDLDSVPKNLENSKLVKRMQRSAVLLETAYEYLIEASLLLKQVDEIEK